MAAPLPAERQCCNCGEVKAAHHFYVKSGRLSAYCRPCERAMTRDRIKRTYRADPAFRERVKRRVAAWKRTERGAGDHAETRRWHRHAARRHVETLFAARWRRVDIAAALGCCPTMVSHWRSGRSVPTPDNLRRLRALAEATAEGRIVPPTPSQRVPKALRP